MRKVLVSLSATDLRVIDEAARKTRPIDAPGVRRAFAKLVRKAESRKPITTTDALAARERGRR